MHRRVLRLSAPLLCLSGALFAASHRNGPLLLEDQTANLNDFYIFRSYETGKSDRLVMSMSAQGFQNPDNGPSYYKFSDSVLYRFSINNSRGLDGNPDINIDFTFQTTLRENNTFLSYLGPITSIDSAGILLYQTYSVVVRNMKTGQTDYFTTDKNGHRLSVELRVLMLHGMLHLAGLDHERDNGEMARKERRLRAKLGLPLGLIERVEGQGLGIREQGTGSSVQRLL